jgi:cyclopropane-fatty-acyl-phospholipid synthase
VGSLAYRLKHLLNRNSRRGSRKNIHAHYDLGNPFYRLWLDETMNYSSAWFDGDPTRSTPQAQAAKVRRALDECGLKPGQRLLEIGCGWGAVAEAAAADIGAQVTGVTLSDEQLAYARERLNRRGLSPLADLRLQDYRDIRRTLRRHRLDRDVRSGGPRVLGQLLPAAAAPAQAGRQGLHPDHHHPRRPVRALRAVDRLHPAVHLSRRPAAQPAAFPREAHKAGLEVVNELAFGADYAETLRRWRVQFLAQEAMCASSASTPASCASGSSTWPTARRPSRPATPSVVQFTLRRA